MDVVSAVEVGLLPFDFSNRQDSGTAVVHKRKIQSSYNYTYYHMYKEWAECPLYICNTKCLRL